MTDEAKGMPESIFATPAPSERDKYASRWPSDMKTKTPQWGFWSDEEQVNEGPVEYIRADVFDELLMEMTDGWKLYKPQNEDEEKMISKNWVRLSNLRDKIRRTRLKVYLWEMQSVLSAKEEKLLTTSREHLSRAERLLENVLDKRGDVTGDDVLEEEEEEPQKELPEVEGWRSLESAPPAGTNLYDGTKVLLALDIEVDCPIVVVASFSQFRYRWEVFWNAKQIPNGNIVAWHPIPPGAENFLSTQENIEQCE